MVFVEVVVQIWRVRVGAKITYFCHVRSSFRITSVAPNGRISVNFGIGDFYKKYVLENPNLVKVGYFI
jgi:hypothetical protein